MFCQLCTPRRMLRWPAADSLILIGLNSNLLDTKTILTVKNSRHPTWPAKMGEGWDTTTATEGAPLSLVVANGQSHPTNIEAPKRLGFAVVRV